MPPTRMWGLRIPVVLWQDLVISGRLDKIVKAEIERAMLEHGYVKMKHGRRWFWFKAEDVREAAGK